MSDKILVSTRKGLFTISRKGGKWDITAADFLGDNVTLTLTDRRDATEAALSRVRVTSGLAGLPTDFAGLQAAWAEHDPVWRRALVRVVIERVTIHPTEVRGRFDPDRIEIGWRSPGESAKPAPTTPAATRLIERTAASRAAAGLPLNVDEAAALRRIAVLLRDSD